MRVVSVFVCFAVAALAGCGRRDEPPAPATPVAADQAAPPPVPTRPVRRPGLWEISTSLEGVDQVQVTRLCVDVATDAKLALTGGEGRCRSDQTRQDDGAWRFSTTCDAGSGGTTSTVGTASGDFTTTYEVRGEVERTGAAVPQMNGERKVTSKAAWRGSCPADMKPGDMAIPGGPTIPAAG